MYVYLVGTVEDRPKYKIGRSKDPESRLKQLQTANGAPLEVLQTFQSRYPAILETHLHKYFHSVNYHNEWFALEEQDILDFKGTCQKFENNFLALENNSYWRQQHGLDANFSI